MKLFEENTLAIPFKIPQKKGYSFTFDKNINAFRINIPNGYIIYSEHYLKKKYCDYTIDYLLKSNLDWQNTNWRITNLDNINWENINWKQDKVNMFGKEVFLPRLSAWYGDENKPYTYSGLTLQPNAWNKGLIYLKDEISKLAGVSFNSVLLNWYRDGQDSISWHTDAEKELGTNPIIGSVNFGTTRRFLLRRKDDRKEKIEIPLKHGTFLVMGGELQHYWQHSIPKERKINQSRVNLTFRIIKT
jgi:alkylated DNA repair dioxygenase AlkB